MTSREAFSYLFPMLVLAHLLLPGCVEAPPCPDSGLGDIEPRSCVISTQPLFEHSGTAAAPRVDFGSVSSGQPVEMELHFSYETDCIYPAAVVYGQSDELYAVGNLEPAYPLANGQLVLPVAFEPDWPGTHEASLYVSFEADQARVLQSNLYRIGLSGELLGGTLSASVDTIDMEVPVGCEGVGSFEVTTDLAGSVRLNGIDFKAGADPAWQVAEVEGPILLEPGSVQSVEVVYSPVDVGTHEAAVRVRSPHTDNAIVELRGTSFYPNQHEEHFESDGQTAGYPLAAGRELVEGSLEVRVGGVLVPDGWFMDESTGTLFFEGGNVPDAGVSIQVNYVSRHDC